MLQEMLHTGDIFWIRAGMIEGVDKRIGIVVVSYKSDDATVRFVREVLSKISLPAHIVIVDNGATDEAFASLSARLPETTVLQAENLGYARGNNLGVQWLADHVSPEYILFSNNDVEFASEAVVESLVRLADMHPEAAAFGPAVVGPGGDSQSPEPYMGLWKRYFLMYAATPFLRPERKRKLFYLDYGNHAEEGLHYRLSGSFFLVRTADFIAAGMFDPHTFLYAEECILSERLSGIGKGCFYFPAVKVIHRHGETVRRHYDGYRSSLMEFDSMAYYYQEYRGYSRWQILLVRGLFRAILHMRRWQM